jgi:aspartate ammonia-lyase
MSTTNSVIAAARRLEKDALGEMALPDGCYWGIHTERSRASMSVSGRPVSPDLVRAMALVKQAAASVNRDIGLLPFDKADAIIRASAEVAAGAFGDQFPVDALQGGAGTSTNMNVNEVIAARASELMGARRGDRSCVSPLEDVNLHQSTNDVYPTALRVAAILRFRQLAQAVAGLQGVLQRKERLFASIVKVGRTELQEAVPMTLGQEFGAFAEAISRDRWRIFKCEERLRVVNLGGTAIGTGLTAPRDYIFRVVDRLRELTAIGLARGENLAGETANADALVEAAGMLKAFATNLVKIANDLRLLNLLGEIRLPPVQAGSSIMPGKVNPVVCEMVAQVGLRVMANDHLIGDCASRGTLQINEYLPLVAETFLESLSLLEQATLRFALHVEEITADEVVCCDRVLRSEAIITALLPALGYERCTELVEEFRRRNDQRLTLVEFLKGRIDPNLVESSFSPEALLMLGHRLRGGGR